jgi:hypothetical protein
MTTDTDSTFHNEVEILVELKQRSDLRGTTDASITPSNIVEKSSEALGKAMLTIKNMAGKIVETVGDIPISQRPNEIEVEFGLKLTTDAKAFIVNAGTEAHFTVKMKWTRSNDPANAKRE